MTALVSVFGRPTVKRAGSRFCLRNRPLPGFPLVVDRDGGLIEPIDHYLKARVLEQGASVGSATDEAHILREWWGYCHHRDRRTELVTLGFVSSWANAELELARKTNGSRRRGEPRVRRSLQVIQAFLQHCASRDDLAVQPSARSLSTTRIYIGRVDQRWSDPASHIAGGRSPQRTGPGRPTPTPAQVEQVLEELASRSDYFGVRDYLSARWMSEVGLRRSGVASLTISSLAASLRSSGLRPDLCDSLGRLDSEARLHVRRFLVSLSTGGTEHIEVLVREKSRPEAPALAPLPLVEGTLDYVWNERRTFIERYDVADREALWISQKTKKAISAKAIADGIKQAFELQGVEGSAQRLRASFAEFVMWEAFVMARQRDPEGLFIRDDDILELVAQRLRHRGTRSLRHYLNRAKRLWRELAISGQP